LFGRGWASGFAAQVASRRRRSSQVFVGPEADQQLTAGGLQKSLFGFRPGRKAQRAQSKHYIFIQYLRCFLLHAQLSIALSQILPVGRLIQGELKTSGLDVDGKLRRVLAKGVHKITSSVV
jgi:hypothetical protein